MVFRGKWTAYALLFLVLFFEHTSFVVLAADIEAPKITNVQVTDVTETSVKVTWSTDEKADSLVNYGLREDYGIIRKPVADKTTHEILLEGLEPGRKYHFRVVSSDETGNQGISADYQVELKGQSNGGEGQAGGQGATGSGAGQGQSNPDGTTPGGENEVTTSQSATKKAIEAVQQVSSPEQLQQILNETIKAINGVTEDLAIVGPPTVIPETTTALIKWTTDRDASSEVDFAPASQYIDGKYTLSQSSLSGNTRDHEVRVIGLESFTEYHFRVRSKDTFGIEGSSRDFTFTTKASLPQIKNLRVVKVEENSATLAWDTTVPAKALIEYQNLTTGEQNSKGRPTLAANHQMKIDGLVLGARYVAFVIAENSGGDRVKSNPITFITAKDTEPPIISNVTNESTIFPGSEARIQTIIAWQTDEASLCSLSYREGIQAGTDPTLLESEDKSFTERHVEVIVDFAPATVYKFSLICKDEANNESESEDFVLFTPVKEKNIIDIIIENFEGTFGWVKNIGI
jgi:hypothetical protein